MPRISWSDRPASISPFAAETSVGIRDGYSLPALRTYATDEISCHAPSLTIPPQSGLSGTLVNKDSALPAVPGLSLENGTAP